MTTIKHPKSEPRDFDQVKLSIASPEKIAEWSCGEVTKAETINYRTQRSEKNGLFDEKIFGPERDNECYCGKYKGIRYKGIVCEKCGVEITRSIVRRERMGHIELATPVAHIWFLRSMPSRIGMVMGMSLSDLEKVIYFAGYIVTKVDQSEKERFLKDLDNEYKNKVKTVQDEKTKEMLKELVAGARSEIENLKEGMVLDEVMHRKYSLKYGTLFEAGIGAEAVYNILKNTDLNKLEGEIEKALEKAGSLEREKLHKRLAVVRQMIASGVRPEWMFMTRIPVIPPALRPMVALEGGRFAASDVNDLYRRIINRNNRLLKHKEINAPEVIIRNEKRILQEAVDALIDNTIRHGSTNLGQTAAAAKRQPKSLSDSVKGKRGLFRQNLLGKRVDYSGRSVIVVGPELNLNQCGLPKHMALELFRPFVIQGLLKKELAFNIRGANRLIDDGIPETWAILEEVIKGKYVLLNRAPTLHRLGIQAFMPVLIEGNAIQVHPLVCTAFNADFDGDQMAVHVPLSEEAQMEAREIMASNKNVLKPGSGDPTISSKLLDVVLGCFWVTKIMNKDIGEGKFFESPEAAILAKDFNEVGLRAKIKVLPPTAEENEKAGTPGLTSKFAEFGNKVFETTVGRLLFNQVLPDDYPFINKEIDRKMMSRIVDDFIVRYGPETVAPILDKIKKFGFGYTTMSGITWGIDDIKSPEGKNEVIAKAKGLADTVMDQYHEGLLTEEERLRKNIEIWHKAKSDVEKLIPASLDKEGSVYDMVTSGARGSLAQITQMAGMKGLISSTSGETIEFPILSCSKDGLTPIEYFITTHGSRKGLTDTALNTAKAGYLTRKLFVVAQDVMVSEQDCGTKDGIEVRKHSAIGVEIPLAKNIKGRILSEDAMDSKGAVIFKKGHLLTKEDAQKVEDSGAPFVKVRSPLSCKSVRGVCANCYGLDLGRNKMVDLGEAVGTIAGQAIGEPGTQLTMRTFHAGGTASQGGDITAGLPRVEEIFEKRKPKNPAAVSSVGGVVTEILDLGKEKVIKILANEEDRGQAQKTKKRIGKTGKSKDASESAGKTGAEGSGSASNKGSEMEYFFNPRRIAIVKVGDHVKKGDILTDGSADIDEMFMYAGQEKAKEYVINEVSKIYELQGETVARKHIEVIVKQMFSRKRVTVAGDTLLSEGEIVSEIDLAEENAKVALKGGEQAVAVPVVMGITDVSLTRRSFLSAASFQHTTRVLIANSIKGLTDNLNGLMENVIIGRLIPAGTGFAGSPKYDMVKAFQDNRDEAERRRLMAQGIDVDAQGEKVEVQETR